MSLIYKPVVLMEPSTETSRKSLINDTRSCSSCSSRLVCISQDTEKNGPGGVEHLLAKTRRIPKNQTLYQKHEQLKNLYLVRFGQFKMIGEDLCGDQCISGFYLAGDVLGMDAIATGQHQYRIVALENSEVCEIPFENLGEMMINQHGIQRRLFQAMSESLNNHCFRASISAKTSMYARFASFLLILGKKYNTLGYSDRSFRLQMSRSDIASYLGTSVETVSRSINRLNAHGAASITGRQVKVYDQSYLQALVRGHEGGAFSSVPLASDQQDIFRDECHTESP